MMLGGRLIQCFIAAILLAHFLSEVEGERQHVAADVSINADGQLVLRNFRYSAPEALSVWVQSSDSSEYHLTGLQLDATLSGTPEVLLQDLPVQSHSIAAVHFRTLDGSTTLASAFLDLSSAQQSSRLQAPQRRLLQSSQCDSSCSVAVNGQPRQFCFCQSLGPGGTVNVLNSAVRDGQMDIALSCSSAQEQWCAIAFPSEAGTMQGAQAVIIRKSSGSNAASIREYYLGGYDTGSVVPANNLQISNTQVNEDGNTITGTFTIQSGGNVKLDGSSQNIIFAAGRLTGSGGLRQHDFEGDSVLRVVAGTASEGPATVPAGAPTPAARTPSVAPSQPKSQPLAATPTPTAAKVAEAPAPAPSTAATCPPVVIGSNSSNYQRCLTFPRGITFFWNVPSTAGSRQLQGALTYSGTGWGSVAFARDPGVMIGSSAIILADFNGGYVNGYYLASETVAGVQPPARFGFVGTPVVGKSPNGLLGATFTIDVSAINVDLQRDFSMLWASGQLSSGSGRRLHQTAPRLQQHQAEGDSNVNLLTSGQAGSPTEVQEDSSNKRTLWKAHGFCMAIAYGILLPIGIGIARNFKSLGPAWFYMHIAVQLTGYLLGLAGWIIGWVAAGGVSSYGLHMGLGIAVMALFTLQLSALLARPKHESPIRRVWNLLHWWGGRIGLGLAVWNIYLGLTSVYPGVTGVSVSGWTIAFSVVFGVIVGSFFLLESVRYAKLPPPGLVKRSPVGIPDDAAGRYTGVLPDEAVVSGSNGSGHAGNGTQFMTKRTVSAGNNGPVPQH